MDRQGARRVKLLTDLIRKIIVTEAGEKLGHVRDVRCRGAVHEASTLEAYALVYGELGWLQRMGLRDTSAETCAWSDVVRIDVDTVVVRDGDRRARRAKGKRRR
jgi:sporulation protein YlmC with PRC-barrel domain